ncbi:MAG TPA: amidohydrolase [Rhodanobacteraceae bacterium]|nr:amidohydrolase [Rhodanobacteraceae bacterium]
MRLVLLAAATLLALTGPAFAADTLLVNATIHTMDEAQPEASAMVWDEDGKLLAVGASDALSARYPDAQRLDAKGAAVIPGLIDAHGHMLDLGMMLSRADLVGAASKAETIQRLRDFARKLPKGAWLLGYGWDQNDWPDHAFPTAADLDAVFPDRPVYLDRVDGHAAWVNTAAIKRAKKSLDGEWQPDGGHIERVKGKATGVLVDGAIGLVSAAIPAATEAQVESAYKAAFQHAIADGLTGVHDAGVELADFKVLQKLAKAGEIPLRLNEFARPGATLDWLCAQEGSWRDPGGRLRMHTVKLFIDGALGSRGAALLADYSDDHGNRGLFVTDPKLYRQQVAQAHRCNVQVATHAIGDRGNRTVIDTYAAVLGDDAIYTDHRWRIEHAQILDKADIPRVAELHLIASMQPTHATSDMPWAEQRLGKARLYGAYAWQRFLHEGVPLAFGSDFPVEDVNPFLGLYAAVTRQDLAGQPPGGWLPDQRVSRKQALAGFTRGAAYAGFMEQEVGQLKAGMRADFVILSADPITVPARQIADIKPLSTWVDGKAVYHATP